jgi:hypothetical protein
MKLVTPPEHPRVNVLVYGRGKSGKTNGAGTAPTPIFYFNADLPNATRRVHRRLRRLGLKIIEPGMPQFEPGSTAFWDLMVETTKLIANPDCGIATIAIDPVDELYRRLLEELSGRLVRPSLSTYGDVSKQVERFCRFFCELPHVNCIIVCHELAQKNEATGEIEKIPFTGTKAGSEGMAGILESMVDIVAYSGTIPVEGSDTPRYVAQLVPARGRSGGDRFAALGPYRDFDISEWLTVIEAYEAAEDLVPSMAQPKPPEEPQEPPEDPTRGTDGPELRSRTESTRKAA